MFPENDTFGVETCRSVLIYIFIIILLSLVDLQIIAKELFQYLEHIHQIFAKCIILRVPRNMLCYKIFV